MRFEFHLHTKFSHDSLLSFRALARVLKKRDVDGVAITDHNTIKGALAFRAYCEKKRIPLSVLIGEEIMTAEGELIGLFLTEEIPAGLSAEETADLIHAQGGLVCLPHPADQKRRLTVLTEEARGALGEKIDLVEAYNGRTLSLADRERQKAIANQMSALALVGSDAHTKAEAGRTVVLLSDLPHRPFHLIALLKEAVFLTAPPLPSAHRKTKWARLFKLLKRGDLHGIFNIIRRKLGR